MEMKSKIKQFIVKTEYFLVKTDDEWYSYGQEPQPV